MLRTSWVTIGKQLKKKFFTSYCGLHRSYKVLYLKQLLQDLVKSNLQIFWK